MRRYVPQQAFNGLTLRESAVVYLVSGIGARLVPVKDGDDVISHNRPEIIPLKDYGL
jgi:hypothetical protein